MVIIKFIVKAINYLIKGLGLVLKLTFNLFPSSPFKLLDNSPIAEFLGGFNYFFPVNECIAIGETWLAVIAAYYIYQGILRWMKAIE